MTETIDFAIITAIQVEREAVCQSFGLGDQHRVRQGVRTYWKTQVEVGDGQFYTLVVTQLADAASVDGALAARDAIATWHPRALLMVGIAGAAKETVNLGDVVLGEEIYYYERGKTTAAGPLPEPKQYPADSTLWDRVITVAPWDGQVPLPRPDGSDGRPRVIPGVIASGEQVIADGAVRDRIAASNRKIVAIEMEGYGVSAAAWKLDQPVPCLVIRGISDRADAHKGDDWQPYAARAAAAFTRHFLGDRPLTPQKRTYPPADQAQTSPYRVIIDALKNGNLVPFLGSGIHPQFYTQLALELAEFVKTELWSAHLDDNPSNNKLIHKLIGIPCSVCAYWPQDRPPGCPMIEGMGEAESIEDCPIYTEQGLAVSKINLRYLSQYYILKSSSLDSLYTSLYEILSKLRKTYPPNGLHQRIAELPALMKARNKPVRSPGLPFQLIITTNYDDMIEQAFLKAQQPFDVIFYVADGPEKGRLKYQPYQDTVYTMTSDRANQLPLRSPWGNCSQPRPIILKLFGTWEQAWENHFIATDEQLAYLISTLKQSLPPSLISILTRGNLLFLGYSPNDSDLQLLINCLWPDNKLANKSWLLHQAKPGDLEIELWKTRNVELLPMGPSLEDFVKDFQADIDTLIR
ncbi:MAG: SIR2 family protein [Nodosilinea sp.]